MTDTTQVPPDWRARDALIESIYASSVEPPRWSRTLGELSDYVSGGRGETVAAIAFAEGPAASTGWILVSTQAEAERAYDLTQARHALLGPARSFSDGGVVETERFTPPAALASTTLAREFLHADGSVHGLTSVLHQSDRLLAVAHVLRRRGGHAWPDGSVERFASVGAHLGRAIDVYARLRRAREHAQVERVLLDHLDIAALVLEADGRILRRNAAADELLLKQDGLIRKGDHLHCDQPRLEDGLLRVLNEVFATARAGVIETSLLLVPRQSGRRPLMLFVSAVPAADGSARAVAATMLVRDADTVRPELESIFARLFDLTPSEVRVAIAIAQGDTPNEVADHLGLSVETVRSHLKRVFFKTATRRQADLVRLVFGEMPPVNL